MCGTSQLSGITDGIALGMVLSIAGWDISCHFMSSVVFRQTMFAHNNGNQDVNLDWICDIKVLK